jgi:hypothetical protein
VYRLTYDDGRVEEFETGTRAIRGMARAVRAQLSLPGERQAFAAWYDQRNYRSAAASLRDGHRYELGVQVNGERRVFTIEPPPPPPFQHRPKRPVTRTDAPPTES